ncbi:MAG: DnaD domain protein [Lachnospiraceae bacterium]|nr:DnaD domain protein [Lachnospiraceae bacterium]
MTWEFNSVFQVKGTLVANAFIDEYMAGANGDYVKVYLYLLRHQDSQPEPALVAEALHYTEGDVKRAIAYWVNAGVLAAGPETSGISGRETADAGAGAASGSRAALGGGGSVSGASDGDGKEELLPGAAPAPVYSKELVSRLSGDENFSQLLYIAQKYMNKVFTQRECQVFAYLYGELKLSAELLEYLVEYCVQNGHTSIRYMETVALNWHQKGLVTLEAAKAYSAGFNKDSFAVMKAFGLNDRRPAEAEKRFIENWFRVYGFSREVVLEACNRTIEATHTPSFKYADKILSEWKKAGVKNLSDVEDLDMIRQKQEKERAASRKKGGAERGDGAGDGGKRPSGNRFHNFEPSTTDYDSLMMEKIRARMKDS